MRAQQTRALLEANEDYYLVPLSATPLPESEMETYLQPLWEGRQALIRVERTVANGETVEVAEGYESTATLSVDD